MRIWSNMENAIWGERLLTATDIAKDYQVEKEVRKASGRKELRCPDPECQHPIIRYCHGEIKEAFFAHLNNRFCDYADFDKTNTQVMRNVRRRIYEHFKAAGYQVRLEVKVLEHHYTHLLFDMYDGNRVAVEIGTQQLTANLMDSLTSEYRKNNIFVKWIVIANAEVSVNECQTYFLKRYLLNESANKDLIVVSGDTSKISQHKVDLCKYEYDGENIESNNYPETYTEIASLADLTFEGNELSIMGFSARYEIWLNKKHKAFNKRIVQLEEESRRRMEEIALQAQEKNRIYCERQKIIEKARQTAASIQVNHRALSQTTTYERCKQEVLPIIAQQQIQAHDSLGNRWVKCEKCGIIDTDDKFVSYGGQGRLNLGTCSNCSGSKRRSSQ